ncbi:hypothetical protein [Pantoea rwandensis]|uniref:Uncharacterized protein n=1 Tax=Pantoea rwandensis TaxID=1076550 RepID=A0ABM5RNQ4_9GAMM|nr:hypothetical protein [Pantoea rwandensis]AIR87705.1 hypothetical protein LH22_20370 [Pantoea rwandensis]
MRKPNTPPSELICDMLESERARTIYTVLGNLIQCAIRVIIFRPLILFSCLVSVVMAAVPVAVFISPAYTPEVLNAGLLRTLRLVPDSYIPLCLAGLLFELVYQVRKIVRSHHDWPENAGKGRGQ